MSQEVGMGGGLSGGFGKEDSGVGAGGGNALVRTPVGVAPTAPETGGIGISAFGALLNPAVSPAPASRPPVAYDWALRWVECCSVSQCVAVCCSALLCVAVCCSVL